MISARYVGVSLSVALLLADGTWKDKQAAEWTDEEAHEILTESPWAKLTYPKMNNSGATQGRPGGMGRRGGMGGGGMGLPGGIGFPGGPRIGGRGGMGGPRQGGQGGSRRSDDTPPIITIRWESALPVQQAELKIKDNNAPSIDEGNYALMIVGLPNRIGNDEVRNLESHLKGKAELKLEGKKAIKPDSVRVISRDEGPVVIYLFSRSHEITKNDKNVIFDAKIGSMELRQAFDLAEMNYTGKLQL